MIVSDYIYISINVINVLINFNTNKNTTQTQIKMIRQLNIYSIIAVFILITSACSSDTSQSNDPGSNPANTGMTEAPDFEVKTIDGDVVSLQQSMEENKPMVVYFTASWCPTCAQNWPSLSEVYEEYKDRLNLVAIGIDPTDDEEVMRELSEKEGFTFPVTKGLPQVMVDFDVKSQATTVGINRDGYIAFQKNNTVVSAEEYRELFDGLLN